MQQFSIKQLEHLSGIKAHTIRIWEKRYKIITPERSDGKHRMYSNEDLKSLLRIVYLYNKGLKISKIARLKEQELLQKVNVEKGEMNKWETIMPGLMEACADLDPDRITHILKEVKLASGFEQMVLNLLYPFFEKLGKAWVTGKIQPNNEHLVSQIIRNKIIVASSQLDKSKSRANDPMVLLFQPLEEYHEIPLLFINYLLCKRGHRTIYFGSHVSLEAIAAYCNLKPVTHIHYHQVTNLSERDPQDYLDEIAGKFPFATIVASGPATQSAKANSPNIQLLRSQADIMNYVNQFDASSAESEKAT